MKAKEMRKKSDKELEEMLKDAKFQLIKAKSIFGKGQAKVEKGKKSETKGMAGSGMKTSLEKDIRRNIARILTIQKERKLKNATTS